MMRMNGIVAMSATGLTLIMSSVLLQMQGLLAETTTVIVMPMMVFMGMILTVIITEN